MIKILILNHFGKDSKVPEKSQRKDLESLKKFKIIKNDLGGIF